ncbi:MAG TPA: PfkB family carbohydrate kinase, partial [Saprospiraceae bacterium]|nr:PfkB family carbohydrate kinase [Saprospiraceae bacterium]
MITREELKHVLQQAEGLRAVVIGDVMLDKYVYGSVDRISPEAPVPIVTLHHTDVKAGGAANVAANLAAWGCKTSLIGLVGDDDHAREMTSLLDQLKIEHGWITDNTRPTTVKTRVVASSHHLLRIDE